MPHTSILLCFNWKMGGIKINFSSHCQEKDWVRVHCLKKKIYFSSPILVEFILPFPLFFSVGAYDLGSSRVNNISLLISMRRRLNESVALSHLELSLWIVQGLTKWRLKEPYKIWQTNSCNGLRAGRVKVGHTYISIYFQCPFWLSCSIIKYKTILVWRLLSNTLRCDLNLSQADFGTLKSGNLIGLRLVGISAQRNKNTVISFLPRDCSYK